MREKKHTGIVINSKPIFEKDKRIDIFTDTQGRKSFILKRGQTKPYPFSGALEPLNLVHIESYQGKSMVYIKQCSLQQSFPQIRQNFNALSLAGYILDILKKATQPHQKNTALYTLTHQTLLQLNEIVKNKSQHTLRKIQHHFEHHFLFHEGLLEPNTTQTHQQFREQFYLYTGKLITAPILLNDIINA